MTSIRCFILENNPVELKWCLSAIETIDGLVCVGSADNLEKAKTGIDRSAPDIVFADIELNDCSAFDVLDSFSNINFKVVFITSFDHYAINAIKKGALDYFVKPVSEKDLLSAMVKYQNHQLEGKNSSGKQLKKIAIANREYTELVELNKVIYFEADASYTIVHFKDRKSLLTSKPLKDFGTMLTSRKDFYRIHQSFLVNTEEIHKIIRTKLPQLIMSNGDILNISRSKKSDFLNYILP